MAAPAAIALRRTAAPRTTLIPASSPDFFIEDTPTAVLVRQVLGAIDPFEKVSTVAKLKAARQRKERTGKCEGRTMPRSIRRWCRSRNSGFGLNAHLGSIRQETRRERLVGFQCDPRLAVALKSIPRLAGR
jgi:DNA invertase Pin-like site-specific DNA recombinase